MEKLRVQWTEFPASLTGALGQLQHAGELADVTLACEGQRIHAHKLVLSACSPYFRDAFKENPCHHPIIILKDVQAQDILNLLSYMYQGEVSIEEDKLSSFIQTAELLQIKGLSSNIVTQSKKHFQKSLNQAQMHPKKNSSQINLPSKKISQNVKDSSVISNIKSPMTQQKRRRNSASDRLSENSFTDTSKKVKMSKDKHSFSISKKNDGLNLNDSNKDTCHKNDNCNSGSNDAGTNQSSLDDSKMISNIEIKHELDEPPDEEEIGFEDNSLMSLENPTSPTAYYENSMLARSLLSGAQILKTDNTNISKSKLATQLSTSNNINIQTTPTKFTIISEEGIVKTEKLSPRPEVMELEPEVLISEQDDEVPGTSRSLIPKNIGQLVIRTDQTGPSTSQTFNQTNHAAICGDCPHCGTKYSNQSALKYHVRLMHSDLTNRLCCYLCPRSFTMRDTFKEHMWTSHGQRN